MPVFAQLILEAIEVAEDHEKYELLHGALKLFAEIDINGDQQMEWSEFMQYMVDAVGSTAASTQMPGETATSDAKKTTVTQVIEKMQAQQFKRYYMNKALIDKTNHNNYIIKAYNCRAVNNLVFFLERQQREVRFFSKDTF